MPVPVPVLKLSSYHANPPSRKMRSLMLEANKAKSTGKMLGLLSKIRCLPGLFEISKIICSPPGWTT